MAEVISKKARITTWVLSGLLGFAFVASGLFKLLATGAYAETVAHLSIPDWAIPAIGIVELTAAIAIVVPRTRFYGALALGATMLGALVTHLVAADIAGIGAPIVLGLLAGLVAWLTRPLWVSQRLGVPA